MDPSTFWSQSALSPEALPHISVVFQQGRQDALQSGWLVLPTSILWTHTQETGTHARRHTHVSGRSFKGPGDSKGKVCYKTQPN